MRGLSIADQQVVEIAKALSLNANVLIMDEPTAALSLPEVERLFAIVRALRERDVAILFITHRLDEVFALTQRMTIMRDGVKVFDALTADMTIDAIVEQDGRPRSRHVLSEGRCRARRSAACRCAASRATACSRTFRSTSTRARSSRWRDSSARGAAKSRGRSSASIRSMRAK